MCKYIFSKTGVYLIILVIIVPVIILLFLGNAPGKQIKNNAPIFEVELLRVE